MAHLLITVQNGSSPQGDICLAKKKLSKQIVFLSSKKHLLDFVVYTVERARYTFISRDLARTRPPSIQTQKKVERSQFSYRRPRSRVSPQLILISEKIPLTMAKKRKSTGEAEAVLAEAEKSTSGSTNGFSFLSAGATIDPGLASLFDKSVSYGPVFFIH